MTLAEARSYLYELPRWASAGEAALTPVRCFAQRNPGITCGYGGV